MYEITAYFMGDGSVLLLPILIVLLALYVAVIIFEEKWG